MKKYLLFIAFLGTSANFFAQCPLSVSITSLPDVTVGPVCKSTPILLTAIQSVGAVTPFYYWIINGDTILGTDSTITILADNQFVSLIMSTSTGCTPDSAFSSIQIQTVLMNATTNVLDYNCALDETDIQINLSGNGTSPFNYDLIGVGTNTTGSFSDVPVGIYDLYITDDNGCNDTDQVVVTESPPIILSTTASDIECNQITGNVEISATDGSAPYLYDLVGVGTNTTGSYNDVAVGIYTLYIIDAQSCADTTDVVIVFSPCDDPKPTGGITPNDDGFNDTWLIHNIDKYPDNEVFIFDRWGQRVYHKVGYDNNDGWDVKYLGVGLPVSTYYYVLKISFENEEDIVFKGPISVFR